MARIRISKVFGVYTRRLRERCRIVASSDVENLGHLLIEIRSRVTRVSAASKSFFFGKYFGEVKIGNTWCNKFNREQYDFY